MLVVNVVDVGAVVDGVVDVCVVGVVDMLVKLEEFWTEDVSFSDVVMPVENVDEGVDIVVGDVGMLLPVGELWTVGVVTFSVYLLVEEIEGLVEIIVEVAAVVVDMLMLVVEIWLADVVVGGVGMLFENIFEGVLAEIVVDESVSMLVTVDELWTADVVLGGRCMLVGDIVVAAVLKDCVVMLPQFSSQHNALIS